MTRVLRLPAWLYVYVTAALSIWLLVISIATPWQPVAVTSGSMAPTVRTGDVVFVAEPSRDSVAQNSIIMYQAGNGQNVLHRVFSVEGDEYLTKGDANPTPDSTPVQLDEVRGVARLVIPVLGLPIVWWTTGDYVPLGAWLVLTVLILGFLASSRQAGQTHRSEVDSRTPVAQMAIRQVRILVGFIAIAQYVVDPDRFEVSGAPISSLGALLLTLAVLALTNMISVRAERSGDPRELRTASVAGLWIDTALVVVMVSATGSSGIGWILFALPIVEAAARSRLVGALATWMVLTCSTIGIRIWIANRTETSGATMLDELDAVADQLSVLLLLVVPAAYLAEQLLVDVLDNRRATSLAEQRSDLLQQVVDLGQRVTQLERSLFETLVDATESLGFAAADVVIKTGQQADWIVVAGGDALNERPIPEPGQPGSGLLPADLAMPAVYIDIDDPTDEDAAGLTATGWGTLVRLVVTSADDATVAVRATLEPEQAIDADAIDGLALLLGQAAVGLRNNQLLEDLWDLNEQILHDATHDPLTGLPNRTELHDHLSRTTEAAGPGAGVALLFLDLNGFKPVNDRLGHDAGDHLLRLVAERLQGRVTDDDLVARLGGDEFIVVRPGLSSVAGAERLAETLAKAIRDPFVLGTDPVRVSTAIGIAFTEGPVDPPELLRQADVAMYHAKRDRLVSFRHYEPDMDEAELRFARLTGELTPALSLGQIEMYFQPIVERETGTIVGAESLLRWFHPELGPVPPEDLMAMAEQAGRAAEMNRWILDQSLQGARRLLTHAHPDTFFVTVNATPTEVRLPTFVDHIQRALLASGLQPHNVLIELSERLVLDEDPMTPRNIRRLEDIGVRVLLDDFGSGQTTLVHLRRLPLVGLKLDRSFLVNIDEVAEDEIIVRSIVSMAHELGIYVVGEGVETEAHTAVASRTGIDLLQGYLFGKPMALNQITALMAAAQSGAAAGQLLAADAGLPDVSATTGEPHGPEGGS
ncbi:MAG: signal peptidase I [Actinomycetota bacterium]